MSREHAGWLVWGIWLLALFCPLEGLAVFWHACPWPTFSTTTMSLQARWDFLTVPVVAILAILFVHLPDFKNIQAGTLKHDYHAKRAELHAEKYRKAKRKAALHAAA
jgi:hypothetical protein